MAITDLHMYIFGKGEQLSQEPQKFRCQHGPAECYGNLVENCIVKHSKSGDAVDIMICLHQNGILMNQALLLVPIRLKMERPSNEM